MAFAIHPLRNVTTRGVFARLLLVVSILASSEAIAAVNTDSEGVPRQSGAAHQEQNERPDERLVAQFRAAPLSLTQAIAVVERLHLGSRTVAVNFDVSERPGYRVRTIRNKQVWENVVDVITGRTIGLETSLSMNDLDIYERDNIAALRSVDQELSDAVVIAEKATAGKAISGGLVKESDQVNFVIVVVSDDRLKEVFLEPPRAASRNERTISRRNEAQ
jgi:Peptidase propeptide and YPEB domain